MPWTALRDPVRVDAGRPDADHDHRADHLRPISMPAAIASAVTSDLPRGASHRAARERWLRGW